MADATRRCWCGGTPGKPIGAHYATCAACGGAMLSALPQREHFDVTDDETDFYGKTYWTDYQRQRNFPDIAKRAEADLSERCVFWLERLLEVTRPPGRALEIGCGHGAFVGLLRELGFDALGTELSPWVVEFARRTFGVPVLQGRLESLDLEPGFKCVAAFDVLEHLDDPLGTVRRCAELLAADGVMLIQTPWYRGEGPDWSMFQEEEHVHLFSEGSMRLLLQRAGLPEVAVRPSLFPYDMWVVAGRRPVSPPVGEAPGAAARLPLTFRAMLDLSARLRETADSLAESEADRAARLEQVNELTRLLAESEADRAARLEQVNELTRLLAESEADRAARFEVIRSLEVQLSQIRQTWVWRLYRSLRFRGERDCQ